mgnify:CR=1 FL=1
MTTVRTRIFTVISAGFTIGFLLGISAVAPLRALPDSDSAELEMILYIPHRGEGCWIDDVCVQNHAVKQRWIYTPVTVTPDESSG